MAILLNSILGLVFVVLGLGLFYQGDSFVSLAEGLREKLRRIFGPDLQVHDWVFALICLLIGGLALLSAFMRVAASNYFWVLQ